jgi:DNA ligase-1
VTTLLADVVAIADRVAATRARNAKRDALAELLGALAPDETEAVVGFLVGAPRQGRLGVGWATIAAVDVAPAAVPTLTVGDLDGTLTRLAGVHGAGSAAARHDLLADLLGRATRPEHDFVRRLLVGELRQGANEGVVTEAVARAAGVPAAAVRRAVMLGGDLGRTARVALTGGRAGLDRIGLQVGRAVQPMLASTADGIDAALGDQPASVEWKLDGARIQVHRSGDDVRVFTRNLNDVTDRLPEVVARVRALSTQAVVLDGEVLGLGLDGERPRAFQDTMSRFGRNDATASPVGLAPFFFDVLHADGTDLIDAPLVDRLRVLDEVAGPLRIPGIVTADPAEASAFLDQALAAGHEGVMVKDVASAYQAGRRGKQWRKVKPVHTLDLVILAAEWGHGRRQGWLSNLHLGARGADGGFVMVGKTFKGLTDALLAWQTTELTAREIGREGIVVHVRPELVVEIGLDGVQRSTRYPGGVTLRFARVRRYRPDKVAADADPIDAVRALLP